MKVSCRPCSPSGKTKVLLMGFISTATDRAVGENNMEGRHRVAFRKRPHVYFVDTHHAGQLYRTEPSAQVRKG